MVRTNFASVVSYLFKFSRIPVGGMYQLYRGFSSYLLPECAYHCLLSTYYVGHCSKCFIARITSFDHQSTCITIPILLTRSLKPSTFSVTCRRAGFFEVWYPRELTSSHWPQWVPVIGQGTLSFSFIDQIPHWSPDRKHLLCILLASLVGCLSTLEVRLML